MCFSGGEVRHDVVSGAGGAAGHVPPRRRPRRLHRQRPRQRRHPGPRSLHDVPLRQGAELSERAVRPGLAARERGSPGPGAPALLDPARPY